MAEETVLFVRGENEQSSQDEDATDHAQLWDDTALVKAYDRALKLAKEEAAKRMSLEEEGIGSAKEGAAVQKQSRKNKRGKKEGSSWVVGAPCVARYSVDGVWYEGTITALMPETQSCIVKYVGYNNEEELHMSQLRSSRGEAARKRQQLDSNLGQESDQLHNGEYVEYSEEETKPKRGAFPKSPNSNRMEWEAPVNGGFIPPHRPLRLPPMGVPPMMVAPPPPPQILAGFPEEDAEALSAMLMSWYMSGFHTGYYQGMKQGRSLHNDFNSSRGSSRK